MLVQYTGLQAFKPTHNKLSHVKLGIILDVKFKHGDAVSLLFSAPRVQLKKTKSSGKMSQVEASVQSVFTFLQGRK